MLSGGGAAGVHVVDENVQVGSAGAKLKATKSQRCCGAVKRAPKLHRSEVCRQWFRFGPTKMQCISSTDYCSLRLNSSSLQ